MIDENDLPVRDHLCERGTMKNQPDVLYHYCDGEALLGIIQSRGIWLSDAYSTNDYSEVRFGMQILSAAIDDLSKKLGGKVGESLAVSWSHYRHVRPFIASFTTQGDQLSQWVHYAKNGVGFCIGIERDALNANSPIAWHSAGGNPKDLLGFGPVTYLPDPGSQPKALLEAMNRELANAMPSSHSKDTEAAFQAPILAARLASMAAFAKNEHFEAEKEWRVVYNPLILGKKDDPTSNEIWGPYRELKYRAGSGRLSCYFEHKFDSEKTPFVRSVRLGPNNPNQEDYVRFLLQTMGAGDLEVARSTVPLRN